MKVAGEGSDLAALILVGGASSRMGSPKAYLNIHGLPQWQYLKNLLRPFCGEIYFSSSPKLMPPLKTDSIIVDIFREPIGPLGGIMSAFKQHRDKAFLVLACDLPFFDDEAAKALVLARDREMFATAYETENGVEPLCAIYEPAILVELAKAWAKNLHCPKIILENLPIKKIKPKHDSMLVNANSVEDLPQAKIKKTIRLHFYASLREEAGCSDFVLNTEYDRVADVYSEAQRLLELESPATYLRFAINDQMAALDSALVDQDELICMPPVSGG